MYLGDGIIEEKKLCRYPEFEPFELMQWWGCSKGKDQSLETFEFETRQL